MPDLSVLKQLLPSPLPLHPVHSCSDLLNEVSNVASDSRDGGPMIGQTLNCDLQPPTLPWNASANVSPQHIKPVQLPPLPPPPPPKRPPPLPSAQSPAVINFSVVQQQLPISGVSSSPQPLIDLSPV